MLLTILLSHNPTRESAFLKLRHQNCSKIKITQASSLLIILSSEEILRKSFQNYSHINANLLHGCILEACADPRLERVEAY